MNIKISLHNSKQKTTGFTLIELLVVIAIIAILAAILFPVFGRARENARRSSCQSNLKQIGLGLMQYTQDYDEMLPYGWYGPDGNDSTPNGVRYKWMDVAYPYVKSTQVFSCPSDPRKDRSAYTFYQNLPSTGTDVKYGSYGLNAFYRYDTGTGGLTRTPPNGAYKVGLRIPAIQDASGTVWITDILSGDSGRKQYQFPSWSDITGQPANVINTNYTPNILDDSTLTTSYLGLPARHLDTLSVLYMDGHVKSQNLGQLVSRKASDGKTLAAFTIESDG